jgi:tRNA pseudouridine-54 N-methylase
MPIGERGWAIIVKNALQGNPPDYVRVTQGNLESLIRDINQPSRSQLWVLHEEGRHFKDCKIRVSGTQNSFMLGDYRGFDSRAEELVSKHGLPRISLGRTSYLSSHCVASVISKLERMVK